MSQDRRLHVTYQGDNDYDDDLTEKLRCIVCGEIGFDRNAPCPGRPLDKPRRREKL